MSDDSFFFVCVSINCCLNLKALFKLNFFHKQCYFKVNLHINYSKELYPCFFLLFYSLLFAGYVLPICYILYINIPHIQVLRSLPDDVDLFWVIFFLLGWVFGVLLFYWFYIHSRGKTKEHLEHFFFFGCVLCFMFC